MKQRRHAAALCCALLAGLLAGCGSSAGSSPVMNGAYGEDASAAAGAAYAPEEAYYAADMESSAAYGGAAGLAAQQPQAAQDNAPANVKMIYTADISLESTEFDESVAGILALTERCGGWLESSYLDNSGTYRSVSYSIRVPAEQFRLFCDSVGEICKVRSKEDGARNISEAYYDTQSRLVTQQTKLDRLQELLAQAENMEDIITLESALSETELAIEQLTGTLRHYDSLVGYSTVSIYLREVYKITETEEPVVGFGAKLAAAFRSGSSRFVDGLEDFLIGFASNWAGWLILILIFLVLPAAIVIGAVRRGRRRKRERMKAWASYPPPAPQPAPPAQAPAGEAEGKGNG